MRKLISLLMVLQAGVIHAQVNKFIIEGKIGHLNKPAKVILHYFKGNEVVVDSAWLKNGSFRLSGTVTAPVEAQLNLQHGDHHMQPRRLGSSDFIFLMLENGKIRISGKDSLRTAQISAPTEGQAYFLLRERLKVAEQIIQKLALPYSSLPENQVSDEERERLMEEYKKRKDSIITQFIAEFPGRYISLKALGWVDKPYPRASVLQPLFRQLSPSLKHSPEGKLLEAYIDGLATAVVGAKAPEIAQPDSTGNLVTLSGFKGKYVFVDFWASWCGPCRAENPVLVQAYAKWKNKNFEMIGIGVEKPQDRALWLQAIAKDGLTWPQVCDFKYWENEAVLNYGVKGVPQNFLIDPNGVIIAKNIHGEALLNKLDSIFQQP